MKTMNFTSTKDFLILGAATGMAAIGLSALTSTGFGGICIFALLIMFVVFTILMWPERTRFFVDKPHSAQGDKRPRQTGHEES